MSVYTFIYTHDVYVCIHADVVSVHAHMCVGVCLNASEDTLHIYVGQ